MLLLRIIFIIAYNITNTIHKPCQEEPAGYKKDFPKFVCLSAFLFVIFYFWCWSPAFTKSFLYGCLHPQPTTSWKIQFSYAVLIGSELFKFLKKLATINNFRSIQMYRPPPSFSNTKQFLLGYSFLSFCSLNNHRQLFFLHKTHF